MKLTKPNTENQRCMECLDKTGVLNIVLGYNEHHLHEIRLCVNCRGKLWELLNWEEVEDE